MGLLNSAPILEHQFARLLNISTSRVGVGPNILAELTVGRCTYAWDVLLQNEAPQARVLPEVFDRGKENSECWAASEYSMRVDNAAHFSG